MSEIKSTLDLVLERTRHWTLSAEEKELQQKAEFEKRLHGFLEQYAGGAISADRLGDRIEELMKEYQIADRKLFTAAVIKRIDPETDSRRWLDLLAPAVREPLENITEGHLQKRADLFQDGQKKTLNRLARKHGIRGSAVVPNPQQDPEIQKALGRLRQETQSRIDAIPQSL